MRFWLGTHMMNHPGRTDVPLCLSFGRLRRRKTLPRPLGPIFLDSRGYSELAQHGRYTFDHREYAAFVRRCADEWGPKLVAASVMDWMCEPEQLSKTGMSVAQHQQLTVNSYLILNGIDGSLPWVPVLQGYRVEEYHECAELYDRMTCARLESLPLVGVGSVCKRQGMGEAARIIKSLYARGLHNLHGFGFKVTGLVSKKLRLCRYLASADSMAWSRRARNAWDHDGKRLCGGNHTGGCENCLDWALTWRGRLVGRIDRANRGGTQQLLY